MRNEAEERVSEFYNTVGWENDGNITEDAKRFEDLRDNSKEYVRSCRLRVLRHIPNKGKYILDMASGPIQYDEYLEYSKNFEKRYCVDLSSAALESARTKIGKHGVFLLGSFFDITIEENFFDCSISLHTIYHIDKNHQEAAVRKLIQTTKPGKPVIIVYSSSHIFVKLTKLPLRIFKRMRTIFKSQNSTNSSNEPTLYFHAHPVKWWRRFSDVADVEILPWRSFDSNVQKALFPNNVIGRKMLSALYNLEEIFPKFFANYFQYPMIILTKHGH